MLTYEIMEYYNLLINKFEVFQPSVQKLFDFADTYQKFVNSAFSESLVTLSSTNTSNTYSVKDSTDNYKSAIKTINDFTSTFDLLKCYSEFALLEKDIKNFQESNHMINTDKTADNLFSLFRRTFTSYQKYLQNQGNKSIATNFGDDAIQIRAIYKATMTFYNTALNILSSQDIIVGDVPDNKTYLEIQLLHTTFSFEEFSDILVYINDSYRRLNPISGESSSGLQIVKIESGSLLSKVLGDKNIIEALGLLLTKTIQFLFRKYTVEGQIGRASELRKELLSQAETVQTLQSFGIEVPDGAKRNIGEAFTILTDNLYGIAQKAAVIKINNDTYSIAEGKRLAYLESANNKLLTKDTNP